MDPNMDNPAEPRLEPMEPFLEPIEPKLEPNDVLDLPRSSEPPEQDANDDSPDKKRKKVPKKTSAEVLQRRKEGRRKAAATIAQSLKKAGIGRFEKENKFRLTTIRSIPLINQKNYFTDYLKKDEQILFVRNWRMEKVLQQKMKNIEKTIKKDDAVQSFDDYNLGDIEAEMKKKAQEEAKAKAEAEAEAAAAASVALENDDDDEDDEDDDNDVSEDKAKQGYDTIVIQPGSANLRIGRATDAFPITVPMVIAVPSDPPATHEPQPKRTESEDGTILFGDEFNELLDTLTKDFKARMKYYKRRILPNSRELAANFNRRQEPEEIPDHNDPYKKEWIDVSNPNTLKKVYVGDEALKLPIGPKFTRYSIRYPICNGQFNDLSPAYTSPQQLLGDLYELIMYGLEQLEVKEPLKSLKAIFVIPDLYDKMYVETWLSLLLRVVCFGKVAILQEAVLATFGAGASSACVVDVGAQTTTVTCVDEGLVINDSRIILNYGGDHVTQALTKMLLQSNFPYRGLDLSSRNDDYELAQQLKNDYATFQDADIAVQLYHFYKRKPFESTQKYQFKVFDEVMLAPLALFYPKAFQLDPLSKDRKRLFAPSVDQYSGKTNNPYSKAQENMINNIAYADLADDQLLVQLGDERLRIKQGNPYSKPKPTKTSTIENLSYLVEQPLEKAIIESITNAGIATDFAKTKKFYDNLLIVGGGLATISGYDLVLSDRINIWRPKFLSSSSMDEIMDYVAGERKKIEGHRKQLIDEYKEKKRTNAEQALEDIELDDAELDEIDAATQIEIDLDTVDAMCDRGSVNQVNVLPPPREIDPQVLTWKGSSVYARLKVVNEMWVSQEDWDLLESRCLYYKSLFNY